MVEKREEQQKLEILYYVDIMREKKLKSQLREKSF